jgi:hypothetical protein
MIIAFLMLSLVQPGTYSFGADAAGAFLAPTQTLIEYIATLDLNDVQKKRHEKLVADYNRAMEIFDKKQKIARDNLGKQAAKASTPRQQAAVEFAEKKLDAERMNKEWYYFSKMLANIKKEMKVPWHIPRVKARVMEAFGKKKIEFTAEQQNKIDAAIKILLSRLSDAKLNTDISRNPYILNQLADFIILRIMTNDQRVLLFGIAQQVDSRDRDRNRRDRDWDRRHRDNRSNRERLLDANGNIRPPSAPGAPGAPRMPNIRSPRAPSAPKASGPKMPTRPKTPSKPKMPSVKKPG